jgi:D-glycero-D-manno-heptose 1,7-bisphosphate phosphatase
MSQAAIFLDRDGTLNVDYGYVGEVSQFQFIEGVIEACLHLQHLGYALVLVTNQSGIARGYFSEAKFHILNDWMTQVLAECGVRLAATYYCPHHPEGIGIYRQYCHCRKPHPGLLLAAQQQLSLDLVRSYLVGDTLADLQAAAAAGIGTKVLVRSGHRITPQVEAQANWVLDSLAALPEVIRAGKTADHRL